MSEQNRLRLDLSEQDLEIAEEYARVVVDEDTFYQIRDDYLLRDTEYEEASSGDIIGLATCVLNGDSPEIHENIDYDNTDRLTAQGFVAHSLALSGNPRDGSESFEEMLDTTQIGDEPLDEPDLEEIRGMFYDSKFNGQAPSGWDVRDQEDMFFLHVSFDSLDETDSFAYHLRNYGKTMDMEDRKDALEDDRNFEAWP